MRCPSCHDEYEDGILACVHCDVPLVQDAPGAAPATSDAVPARADARLGTFHPAMAERIGGLLDRRHIVHETLTDGDRVRIVVDRQWRDDLRAELALTWGDLVHRLPEDAARDVLATGGPNPGWYDPPRGGYVDREGRLVVDVDDGEEAETDAGRMVGPALLAVGAMLVVSGWYVFGSSVIVVTGIGLVLVGLLTPR